MSINCKSINCSGTIDCSNLDISLNNPNSYINIGHLSISNDEGSIGIGNYSNAMGNYSIAIGPSAKAVTTYSISIGSNAYASEKYDIAIGGADSSAYAAKTDSSWNCVIGTSHPQFGTSNVKFKGKKNGYADIYCNRIICREILIDKSDTESEGFGETYNLLGNKLTASFTNPSNKQIYDPNNPLNSDKIVASIGYNDLITPSSRQFSIISNGNMYLKPGDTPMTGAGAGNHVYAGGGATTTPPPNGPFDGSCNPVLTATWVDGSWDKVPNTSFYWWVQSALIDSSNSQWRLSRQSDHRIKQNLSSIPPADSLNKLSLTNPTSFNFKKDHNYSDDSLQHGFIAQELKEHFPEAVTVSTGYLPIDLSSVKIIYSDPSKTILSVANLTSYEINDNTKLSITNPSGDTHLVTITHFDNTTNSITLDKNIPDNFIRLRFLVDNFHYVQYDKFIPITISAIKKLKSTQDDVIESIKKLTQRIELLEENN